MAQITFTVPDHLVPRVLDGFAEAYGYQETIPDQDGNPIPNPVSKIKFFRQQTYNYWREVVKGAEVQSARVTATKNAADQADQDFAGLQVE